jgi:hypothetical protein
VTTRTRRARRLAYGPPVRRALVLVCACGGGDPVVEPCDVPIELAGCAGDNVVVDAGGARLANGTAGTLTCTSDIVPAAFAVTAAPAARAPATWPQLASDVIVQARYRRADGSVGAWQPADVLDAGAFADTGGDGIPDLTNVLVGESSWDLFVDVATVGDPPPDQSWFTLRTSGAFVDGDHPDGVVERSLHLTAPGTGVQYLATLGKALVPPGTTLTLAGWNRYAIPVASSGAMARWNEVDAAGVATTKYVMIGDDDFFAPEGTRGWTWRALTLTTEPSTVALNIVPARLNTVAGDMWAAGWQLREDAVYGTPGARVVFEETFASLRDLDSPGAAWESSDPAVTRTAIVDGRSVLQIDPAPREVVTVTQRAPIAVTPGTLYAVHVAMENRADPAYDRTHHTWLSTYLEFLDAGGQVIDHVKVQSFRPVLARPSGAAIVAPPGAVAARFLLAALHKTYAPEPIDKTMTALFAELRLEEATYAIGASSRAPVQALAPDPAATGVEIRARLLRRDPAQPSELGAIVLDRCR